MKQKQKSEQSQQYPLSQRGFTIIELMLTIIVLVILGAIGVSSFATTSQKIATRNLSETLTNSLVEARIGALSTGSRVTLCPVRDVTQIDVTQLVCEQFSILEAGAADGKLGWIIFKNDKNENSPESPDMILAKHQFDDENGKVGLDPSVESNKSLTKITFTRKGRTGTPKTIGIRPKSDTYNRAGIARRVVLTQSGRISNNVYTGK